MYLVLRGRFVNRERFAVTVIQVHSHVVEESWGRHRMVADAFSERLDDSVNLADYRPRIEAADQTAEHNIQLMFVIPSHLVRDLGDSHKVALVTETTLGSNRSAFSLDWEHLRVTMS